MKNNKLWSLSDGIKYAGKSIWQSFSPLNWPFNMQMNAVLFLLGCISDKAEAAPNGLDRTNSILQTPYHIITNPTYLKPKELFDTFGGICKTFFMLKYSSTGEEKEHVKQWAFDCIRAREYIKTRSSPVEYGNSTKLSVYSIDFYNLEEQNNFERDFDDSCARIESLSQQVVNATSCATIGGVLADVVDVFSKALINCMTLQGIIYTSTDDN